MKGIVSIFAVLLAGSVFGQRAVVPYRLEASMAKHNYAYGEDIVTRLSLVNVADIDLVISEPDSVGFSIRRMDNGEVLNRWNRIDDSREFTGSIVTLAVNDNLLLPNENVLEPGSYEVIVIYRNRQTQVEQLISRTPYTFDATVHSSPIPFTVEKPTAERRAQVDRFSQVFAFNESVAERIRIAQDARKEGVLPADLRGRSMVYEAKQLALAGRHDDAVYLLDGAVRLLPWKADALRLKSAQVLIEAGRSQSARSYLVKNPLPQAKRLLETLDHG